MSSSESVFSDAEAAYLMEARLGRLASVAADGSPQNNPVGFRVNPRTGLVEVFGRNLAATRKFRNVKRNPHVALVVDDIASVDPWVVRGIEVRGLAEAFEGTEAFEGAARPRSGMSQAVIRIRPTRIISWGVDPTNPGMTARDLATVTTASDVA